MNSIVLMFKRRQIILIIAVLAPLAGLAVLVFGQANAVPTTASPALANNYERTVLESKFYYTTQFERSVKLAQSIDAPFPDAPVRAGIIPHDITQGQFIAHFFQELASSKPNRIILIGPNHYETGSGMVQTTGADWRTAFGLVPADSAGIDYLIERNYAKADDQVAVEEHSIAAIVPFISYYLPDAKIVPLILKSEIRLDEIKLLSDALDALVDKNTIVLAAVDFSHYLTAFEAERNDAITEKALQNLDSQTILSFGQRFNDYVDSPPSIALLLYWLSENSISQSSILNHANSGLLTGNLSAPTTSYFEMAYY